MKASTLANHEVDTPSLAIMPGGSAFVAGTVLGDVFLHGLLDGTSLRLIERQPTFVDQMAFSPDGNFLAICSTDVDSPEGTTHVWHTPTWIVLAELANAEIGGGHSPAFTPDNAHIVVSHADGLTRIWRLSDRTVQHTFQDRSEVPVVAVDNANAALPVGNDGTVRVWRLKDLTLLRSFSLEGPTDFVVDMVFSPKGDYLAGAAMDGPLHLWDIKTGTLVSRLPEEYGVSAVDFAPNGQVMACGCHDGHIRIVSIPDGKLQRTILAYDRYFRELQFTPDGSALISSGVDGVIKLWPGIVA